MSFGLKAAPAAVRRLLERASASLDNFDVVVFHQASALMLESLRRKLGLDRNKFVVHLEHCGNTVSSTIPMALESVLAETSAAPRRAMLVGFGVGYSWAAASVILPPSGRPT